MDQPCITPNEFGCNRTWLKENPECSAVLIEVHTRTPKGVDTDNVFYELNKREILTNNGKVHSTWFGTREIEMIDKYKYLQMLKITGAL